MLKVFALLIVVLANNTYGFLNLLNNKYLFNGYNPFYDVASSSRHRRDVVDDMVKQSELDSFCCESFKISPEQFKEMKEIAKQCETQLKYNGTDDKIIKLFDCDKATEQNEFLTCHFQCLYRAMNLTDENGMLSRDVIIESFRKQAPVDDEWKKSIIDEYVDFCLTEAASRERVNDKQCSNYSANFGICIYQKILNNCPVDKRMNTPLCESVRNYSSSVSLYI